VLFVGATHKWFLAASCRSDSLIFGETTFRYRRELTFDPAHPKPGCNIACYTLGSRRSAKLGLNGGT
jgi:hypothetical protein